MFFSEKISIIFLLSSKILCSLKLKLGSTIKQIKLLVIFEIFLIKFNDLLKCSTNFLTNEKNH